MRLQPETIFAGLQFWNWNAKFNAGGAITGTASAAYEVLQANGGNAPNLGYIPTSKSAAKANFIPQQVTLAGSPCTIVQS